MKKMLVLLSVGLMILALSGSVLAAGSFDVKGGFDLAGHLTIGSAEPEVKTGFSINGEYLQPYRGNLSIGGGVTFQLEREVTGSGQFSFLPVYGVARLNLEEVPGYFNAQLGYNFFSGDATFKGSDTLEGGIYYGFGFGMNLIDKFNTEVLYSVNNGKLGTESVSYSKVRLAVSYPF